MSGHQISEQRRNGPYAFDLAPTSEKPTRLWVLAAESDDLPLVRRLLERHRHFLFSCNMAGINARPEDPLLLVGPGDWSELYATVRENELATLTNRCKGLLWRAQTKHRRQLVVHELILAAFVGGLGQVRSGGHMASDLYAQISIIKNLAEPSRLPGKIAACSNALEYIDHQWTPGLAAIIYRELGNSLQDLSSHCTEAYQKAIQNFRCCYLNQYGDKVRKKIERLGALKRMQAEDADKRRQYSFNFGAESGPRHSLSVVPAASAEGHDTSPSQLSLPLSARPLRSAGFSAVRLVGLAIPFTEGPPRLTQSLACPPRPRWNDPGVDARTICRLVAPDDNPVLKVDAPPRAHRGEPIAIQVHVTTEFAARAGRPEQAELSQIEGKIVVSSATLRFNRPSVLVGGGGSVWLYATADTSGSQKARVSFQHTHGMFATDIEIDIYS